MSEASAANCYDYVIVGAGSAGAILANRLSEDDKVSVLLLEYGGGDSSIFVRMPSALSIPMNSSTYNWGFESEPEPYLGNRRMNCPRGKVLGGTSSINGMVYVRGHPRDIDAWEGSGAQGWNYANCLPYFKKLENHQVISSEYAGSDGPVKISGGTGMANPLYRAFIEAGVEAGYANTQDYNGFQQEGFGPKFMNVADGIRASTGYAYLRPIRGRKNLHIVKHALVRRLILKNKTATGVECQLSGSTQIFNARREVILAAGAIGSPHLLQVSGIGSTEILAQAGITTVHELAGVGENLQDHLEFNFQYRCKQPITLNSQLNLFNKAKIGLRWLLRRDGLGSTNHFESCAFIRSRAGVQWPDIQYHFLPGAIAYDGSSAFNGHGFQVHVGHNRPTSRGFVRAVDSDIRNAPKIQFNYLQTEADKQGFRDALRLTREIMGQPAMDAYRGEVISPKEDIESDEQIDAFIAKSVDSAYHPCGTCKMGTDAAAVVDPQLKVRGIANLRVVDASVFPLLTNGNINAPTMMLAERAADLIKGKKMLEPIDAPFYTDPQWQARQRSSE
ncbi:MAG: choline dehydrogenase [SAR86 cluster bacterium]|uniref:Choline dehydrogenase n=1 Tax=SAR86 cluster bacterium TaxID=2030880 RepID=A0A2A4MSR2_9GAMM|nr:MAG: choline dehydrogenase [SAR86 cluster bacterium]